MARHGGTADFPTKANPETDSPFSFVAQIFLLPLFSEARMTDQELSELVKYQWMPSCIPLRDALVTFVPNGLKPEPIIEEMSARLGQSVWFEAEEGHKVLMPYDGKPFDTDRFSIEPKAWDYENCNVCSTHIPAMTLCHVTKPGEPYFLLCSTCYERYVGSQSSGT
ncbi:MAG TPA: hypothetical protein VN761_04985 [Candidatus Polarisedimenticolia bacterium]|nr:hypothetical protein [Candidatus Polarisedimenticolia bacterium]